MRLLLPFVMAAITVCACSRDQSVQVAGPQGTQQIAAGPADVPTGASVEIAPAEGTRNDKFSAVLRGVPFTEAAFQWWVNGAPVEGATGPEFRPEKATKGDVLQVQVIARGGALVSAGLTLGNTPPEFTRVKILPEVFRAGDNLYVDAEADDPDGEPVEVRYEWAKNGEPAGTGKKIEASVKRGDKISIKITPCDMAGCGRPIVLKREVRNMPPMFPKESPHTIEGGFFSQTMRANDPDDDPITYALKAAPEGMTIDAATGQVSWIVPADFSGRTSYIVAASDGHGGVVTQTINFEIR